MFNRLVGCISTIAYNNWLYISKELDENKKRQIFKVTAQLYWFHLCQLHECTKWSHLP